VAWVESYGSRRVESVPSRGKKEKEKRKKKNKMTAFCLFEKKKKDLKSKEHVCTQIFLAKVKLLITAQRRPRDPQSSL
jgi:hypothetical protein